MAQPFPDAVAEISITLHGQPVELNGKGQDQDIGKHEDRNREAQDRERHHGAIEPGAGLGRGDHTQRNRDQDRDDERAQGQRDRRLDALADELGHWQVGEDRGAEIAVEKRP